MLLPRASVEICCGCRPCCCRCRGRSCQWNKIFQEDITERLHVATECLMQHFSRYICIAGAGQGGEKCLLKRFLRSFGPVSRNLPLSGFQRRKNLPPLSLSGIISLNETKWSENDIETRIYVWYIINIVYTCYQKMHSWESSLAEVWYKLTPGPDIFMSHRQLKELTKL